MRKLRIDFVRREALSTPYVLSLVKKVKETGSLIDKPKREKPVLCTSDNIAMEENMREPPSISIHRRSQQLNISEISLWRILHKDLGMTPYKVQLIQELKPIDHSMRFRFAKWICDLLTEDGDFGKKQSSFQMKPILILAGMSTSKIVKSGLVSQLKHQNVIWKKKTYISSAISYQKLWE